MPARVKLKKVGGVPYMNWILRLNSIMAAFSDTQCRKKLLAVDTAGKPTVPLHLLADQAMGEKKISKTQAGPTLNNPMSWCPGATPEASNKTGGGHSCCGSHPGNVCDHAGETRDHPCAGQMNTIHGSNDPEDCQESVGESTRIAGHDHEGKATSPSKPQTGLIRVARLSDSLELGSVGVSDPCRSDAPGENGSKITPSGEIARHQMRGTSDNEVRACPVSILPQDTLERTSAYEEEVTSLRQEFGRHIGRGGGRIPWDPTLNKLLVACRLAAESFFSNRHGKSKPALYTQFYWCAAKPQFTCSKDNLYRQYKKLLDSGKAAEYRQDPEVLRKATMLSLPGDPRGLGSCGGSQEHCDQGVGHVTPLPELRPAGVIQRGAGVKLVGKCYKKVRLEVDALGERDWHREHICGPDSKFPADNIRWDARNPDKRQKLEGVGDDYGRSCNSPAGLSITEPLSGIMKGFIRVKLACAPARVVSVSLVSDSKVPSNSADKVRPNHKYLERMFRTYRERSTESLKALPYRLPPSWCDGGLLEGLDLWLLNKLESGLTIEDVPAAAYAMAAEAARVSLPPRDHCRKVDFAASGEGLKRVNRLRKILSLLDQALTGRQLRKRNFLFLRVFVKGRRGTGKNFPRAKLRKARDITARMLRTLAAKRKASLQRAAYKVADRKYQEGRVWVPPGKKRGQKGNFSESSVSMADHGKFWSDIWGYAVGVDLNNPDVREFFVAAVGESAEPELDYPVDTAEVKRCQRRIKGGKAPGPDKVPHYILKASRVLGSVYAALFTAFLKGVEIPRNFIIGRPVLLPKVDEPQSPKEFRPITVLNGAYKLFTSVMEARIRNLVTSRDWWPKEQRALVSDVRGCQEAVLLDKAVMRTATAGKGRTIAVGWVDYQKAYDSVSQEWLRMLLERVVGGRTANCLSRLMEGWATRLQVGRAKGDLIRYRRGLFQGDGLSPLLFCLAISPISYLLRLTPGFSLPAPVEKVTHIFYMDDLKVYARDTLALKEALGRVRRASDAIGLRFGISKCAVASSNEDPRLRDMICPDTVVEGFPVLGRNDDYKYLGIRRSVVDDAPAREETERRVKALIRQVVKSPISDRFLPQVLRVYAFTPMTFTFGTIHWTKTTLVSMDDFLIRMVRSVRYSYPCQGSRARFFLPVSAGGLGFPSFVQEEERSCLSMSKYMKDQAANGSWLAVVYDAYEGRDWVVKRTNTLYRRHREIQTRYGFEPDGSLAMDDLRKAQQSALILEYKMAPQNHRRRWSAAMERSLVPGSHSLWTGSRLLVAETRRSAVMLQDDLYSTNWERYFIWKQQGPRDSPKCRLCKVENETIDHLINGCPKMVSMYTYRHDRVIRELYNRICSLWGLPLWGSTGRSAPDATVSNNRFSVKWAPAMKTEGTTTSYPDLVCEDRIQRELWLVEVTVVCETVISARTAHKIRKYAQLRRELKQALGLGWKVYLVPVVVGNRGLITQSLLAQLRRLPLAWRGAKGLPSRREWQFLEDIQAVTLKGSIRIIEAALGSVPQ